MSAATIVAPGAAAQTHTDRPSFFGILRGELLKISRHRATWIMLALLISLLALPFFIMFATTGLQDRFVRAPAETLYRVVDTNLFVLRAFAGIYLLVLTALVFGMEYQYGTIRVILARGVGRLQLLVAKLLAVTLVALALLVGGLVFDALLDLLLVQHQAGSVNMGAYVTATFWADMQLYVASVAISMVVTILLAASVTILGRSLAFGLVVAVVWFPADNIGIEFARLLYRFTNNDFWLNITAYWLGPNLNAMPQVMQSSTTGKQAVFSGTMPLVTVDATHTLVVTAIYAAVFVAVAVVLMWKRDVKE
jgi:ABC-2 type transport system permease protein